MELRFWRGVSAAAFALVLLVNGLANALPIGGRTTGEVSAMFPVLATPASYAFAIWGVIYALLAGYVVLQWRPRWSRLPAFGATAPWFVLSCLFNVAWVFAFQYLYIRSSVFLMVALLLTLLPLYLSTRSVVGSPRDDDGLVAKLFIRLPFSVYAGWISVATIVNASIGLEVAGWNRWGLEAYWTFLMLVGGAGLAFLAVRRYRDAAFALTVVWGYVAIGAEQRDTVPLIAWIAWALAGALLLVALGIVPAQRRRR